MLLMSIGAVLVLLVLTHIRARRILNLELLPLFNWRIPQIAIWAKGRHSNAPHLHSEGLNSSQILPTTHAKCSRVLCPQQFAEASWNAWNFQVGATKLCKNCREQRTLAKPFLAVHAQLPNCHWGWSRVRTSKLGTQLAKWNKTECHIVVFQEVRHSQPAPCGLILSLHVTDTWAWWQAKLCQAHR